MGQHQDVAIDKVINLAKEPERMEDVDMVVPSGLGDVAEPEIQYGVESYEAQSQEKSARMLYDMIFQRLIREKS